MGIAFLFVLGLCLGSFINVLVFRLYDHKDFVRGRSHCMSCGHTLGVLDLVPVLSWLWLRGRCRYCKHIISRQYPLVELTTAVWFSVSYHYWPADLSLHGQQLLFTGWLLCSVAMIALAIYDRRWMILPNKIIYPAFFIALSARIGYILFFTGDAIYNFELLILSVVVSSGIFFVLHEVSKGQWIGFGDVRLGLLTGTLLASPEKSLLMIFIASLLGTIFAIPKAIAKKKVLNTRFAYGPFLILATGVSILFGQKLIDWYIGSL